MCEQDNSAKNGIFSASSVCSSNGLVEELACSSAVMQETEFKNSPPSPEVVSLLPKDEDQVNHFDNLDLEGLNSLCLESDESILRRFAEQEGNRVVETKDFEDMCRSIMEAESTNMSLKSLLQLIRQKVASLIEKNCSPEVFFNKQMESLRAQERAQERALVKLQEQLREAKTILRILLSERKAAAGTKKVVYPKKFVRDVTIQAGHGVLLEYDRGLKSTQEEVIVIEDD